MSRTLKHFLVLAAIAATVVGTNLSQASADPLPPPSSIAITKVNYFGDGCPPNSISTSFNDDRTAITVLFGSFMASVEAATSGPAAFKRNDFRNCTMTMQINAPQGWAVTMRAVTVRGFAALDQQTWATNRISYNFLGEALNAQFGDMAMQGPHTGDYQNTADKGLHMLTWSACLGTQRTVVIQSSSFVSAALGKGALLTVDSVDAAVVHRYDLQWKQCQPGAFGWTTWK